MINVRADLPACIYIYSKINRNSRSLTTKDVLGTVSIFSGTTISFYSYPLRNQGGMPDVAHDLSARNRRRVRSGCHILSL